MSSTPVPQPAGSEAQSIRVTEVSGTVEVREASSDVWRTLRTGDMLKPSDVVRTGENGTARIEFDGKIRMQVLNSSELTIEEARRDNEKARQTLLRLDIGQIKADVDKLGPDSSFKVKTPTAVSAVRGTTFYLSVVRFAQGLAGVITNLYVDKGRVDFASIEDEVNALFVEAFHASSIGGDGEKTEPKELTAEEREALIKAFESAFKSLGGNPQTGVETGGLPGGPAGTLPLGGGDGENRDALERLIRELVDLRDENSGIEDEDGLDDILEDLDELLLIALKLTAQLLAEGLDLSGGFDFDQVSAGADLGIVSDDRTHALNEALNAEDPADVIEAIATLQSIRDAEKQDLRDALDSILDNQKFLDEDAQQEKEFDAQTGKVFTDVHGNRVRTDQYIYHEPNSSLVRMVSMTLRKGEYQPGITSLEFGVWFNTGIEEGTSLKDLPWNDYMNVVTDLELDPRYIYGEGGSYSQYIVHENSSSEEDLDLYPVDLYAEFRNPDGDMIRFSEHYTDPYLGTIQTNDPSSEIPETEDFWIQGRVYESTLIQFTQGNWSASIEYGSRGFDAGNGSNVDLIDGSDGSQSGDLRGASELIDQLDGPGASDVFDGLDNNHDGDPDNDLHPSYFRDVIQVGYGSTYQLTGYFIPIDNLGQVIDAPGFRVQGLRDLVNPNGLVAGGEYNLEAILIFGTKEEGVFDEIFRIDAIITPEIFTPYGLDAQSTLFPDNFVADDDDQNQVICLSDCGEPEGPGDDYPIDGNPYA